MANIEGITIEISKLKKSFTAILQIKGYATYEQTVTASDKDEAYKLILLQLEQKFIKLKDTPSVDDVYVKSDLIDFISIEEWK